VRQSRFDGDDEEEGFGISGKDRENEPAPPVFA